jgi:hypothetical protein
MKFATMAFVAFAGLCLSVQGVFAAALDAPSGTVILTIAGDVAEKNVDDTVQVDLAQLTAMEPVTIETSTIWTEGKQTFTGVLLKTLMERIGAHGTVIAASALNDYTVEIPMSDAVDGGPILAYALNGTQLSVRDKGPLWVVYPYDASAAYQSEVIYARSIWQVSRMEIKP